MQPTASITATLPLTAAKASAVPWYFKVLIFGAACIPVGVLWDISWHSTIGRDTFWTPAHIVTYMGGLIPGLVCGWLALKTHFWGTSAERAAAVTFWGFRAPIGAWITIWGAFAMLLSAPFDDWWHNTYGLDVQILSPPHSLLAVGMFHVAVGVLLLMVSLQNRSQGDEGRMMFIFTAGVMVLMAAIFMTEMSLPNLQHAAKFYKVAAMTFPLYLVTIARSSKLRWPATTAAAVYMGLMLIMIWVLPVFPGQPKLAPIYNPVERMVPPSFPMLLVVPALGIDLTIRFLGQRPGWLRDTLLALLIAAVFLLLFVPAQWWFSKFLISPAANNWFFAGGDWLPYSSRAEAWLHEFWHVDPGDTRRYDPLAWQQLARAALYAFISARVGLGFGTWMSRVRR